MDIWIKEINVEASGPLSQVQWNLGPFNLVYGRNEQGKTFMVEFLIRSLFKNHGQWSLRSVNSRGKVVVSGLNEKSFSFSPSSRKKLEDFLATSAEGLPRQISRLLVVKGAEFSFEKNKSSIVSPATLQAFLSGQDLLNAIQGKIQKTVQRAKIVDGRIEGNRAGKIKDMMEQENRVKSIDTLFEEIGNIYSGGDRQAVQHRIQELEDSIIVQEEAKQYQAYLLDQETRSLKEKLDQLPADQLEKLEGDHNKLQDSQKRINHFQKDLQELSSKSGDFEWLEQAIPIYEGRGRRAKSRGSLIFPLAIPFLLSLAILSSFLNFALGTFLLIVMALGLAWFYWQQLRSAVEYAVDIDEVQRLEEEFQRHFDRQLSGLPLLKQMRDEAADTYHRAKNQRENLQQEQNILAEYESNIAAEILLLTGQASEPQEWPSTIKMMRDKRRQLQELLSNKKTELAVLNIPLDSYRTDRSAEPYNQERLQALRQEYAKHQARLDKMTKDLDNLKHRLCQETGDRISENWETLIYHSQEKRQKLADKYRRIKARIMAGILVSGVIDEIRTHEDQEIRRKLASPKICEPIQKITGRYEAVVYENGQLYVTDPYGQFSLSDISTGTSEQILLALRLGFAAQILDRDRLFLILDDAFQHADWGRRKRLVNQMIELAQNGWQIIYFTMDDHIKELFSKAGQRHFGAQYRFFNLNGSS